MSSLLDCCEGEEIHGDPHGLHSVDCPEYLARMEREDARSRERLEAERRTPTPTLETLIANTELRLTVAFIRREYEGGGEVSAYKKWLVGQLAAGEHRKGRRR